MCAVSGGPVTRRVFISYAHADIAFVRRFTDQLSEAGIPYWFDEDLQYGDDWRDEVLTHLDGCAAFVPVMSPDSEGSRWVRRETDRAERKGKPIRPIALDDYVNFDLSDLQHEPVPRHSLPRAPFIDELRRLAKADDMPGGSVVPPPTVITGGMNDDFDLPPDATLLFTLGGHRGHVRAVAYSPDGALLASGGYDGVVRIWNPQAGTLLRVISHDVKPAWPLAFLPDGRTVAAAAYGAGGVHLFDVETTERAGYLATGHTDSICDLAISPDGRLLATGSDDRTTRLWDLSTGSAVGRLAAGKAVPGWPLAFSPSGTRLVVSHFGASVAGVWRVDTAGLEQRLAGHSDWVQAVAYSPDDALVATGSEDSTARIWDATSGQRLHTLKGHTRAILAVAFAPVGPYLATGSTDKSIRLWDTRSGAQVKKLAGHRGGIYRLAFSPDGQFLASAGGDGSVRIWTMG